MMKFFEKVRKNKKLKKNLITIAEFLVVAGIVVGVILFVSSKINPVSEDISSNLENETDEESLESNDSDTYKIIAYKKDKKIVIKKNGSTCCVFYANIGTKLKSGKYKLKEATYSWLEINGGWHRYNISFGDGKWIQSIKYSDKYPYTMSHKAYNSLGSVNDSTSCIQLSCEAAEYIYSNCPEGTVVKVVSSKKKKLKDTAASENPKLYKYCGWDPTDPDSDNPYADAENGAITVGADTVYVEKGSNADYLCNIIALNSKGKNIAETLSYKKIDTDIVGTYRIKVKNKNYSAKYTIKVVDTTPPVVTCSKTLFEYEADSEYEEDVNTEKTVSAIKKMVEACVSVNESGCDIVVDFADPEELRIGKMVVVIKATDSSGNVGSCQVTVDISAKEEETTTTKKEKQTTKKKKKTSEKETQKKKSSKKKSSDNADDDTDSEEETAEDPTTS